jgi:hypothetical protein
MQSRFEATKRLREDRYLTRLKQRSEALHYIETTRKCPGLVPWPLTNEIIGQGPDPKLCSQCDLYIDCPILDRLQTKVPTSIKKAAGT